MERPFGIVDRDAGAPDVDRADPDPAPAPAHLDMWHVTLTVAGDPVSPAELCAGLERLADERPFLLAARYGADRAEVTYWEEARDVDDALALALRLWGEHRLTAGLPVWRVAGVEVVDRPTFHRRAMVSATPALAPAGGVRPF